MKTAFVAIRAFDGEPDAIIFHTREDMLEFCQRRPEYEPIETGTYTLADALAIFGE